MSMSAASHLDQATLMSCLLAYHMQGHSRRGNSRFKVQKSHIGWKGCQPQKYGDYIRVCRGKRQEATQRSNGIMKEVCGALLVNTGGTKQRGGETVEWRQH